MIYNDLYMGKEARIRTLNGTTNRFKIGKADNFLPSSCLFNLYAEHIMKNPRLDELQAWIKIGRRNINRYADVLCCACLVTQLCLTLCTPWTVACQAPLCMEILQARILDSVAMPSSRGFSSPRDWTQVTHIAGRFLTLWATREAQICRWYHSNGRKQRETKEPLDKHQGGEWKSWLKTKY